MTDSRNLKLRPTRSRIFLPVGVVWLSLSLVLAACSPQPTSAGAGTATESRTSAIRASATQLPSKGQPTAAFSGNIGTPLVQSYHTMLMLERAADLMLAVVQKIRAGTINPGDISAIAPYVNAFPVAAEELNRVQPPSELEAIWNSVTNAALECAQAYNLLTLRQSLSSQDLKILQASRQTLMSDRAAIERYYIDPKGTASELVAAQQQMVTDHLQQKYGALPLPTLEP